MSHSPLAIKSSSSWNITQINEFLTASTIPMRLAFNDGSGFPRVCSVWFHYCETKHQLIAVSHRNAFVNRCLRKDNKVGFEIATNNTPYKGVRGQAYVEQLDESATEPLQVLLSKYLGDNSHKLQEWLLQRSDEEEVLVLNIQWITAWDFSKRMQ